MVTKKQIVDYVLETPWNINPTILMQMLDEYKSGGDDPSDSALTDENGNGLTNENGAVIEGE